MISVVGAGLAIVAGTVLAAPTATAAPADTPAVKCGRVIVAGVLQMNNLKYNVSLAFEVGDADVVKRIVHDFTNSMRRSMTEYNYCDRYTDVKALVTQGNTKLADIDAVAEAGGDLDDILAAGKVAQSYYKQAAVLIGTKR